MFHPMKRTAYPSALRIDLAASVVLHGTEPHRNPDEDCLRAQPPLRLENHTRRTGIWVFNFLWEALYATSLLGNSLCGSCRGDAVSFWKVTCTCRQVTFISIVSVSLHLCVSILLVFSSCTSFDYRRTLKCKASQRSWKSPAFPRKGRRGC